MTIRHRKPLTLAVAAVAVAAVAFLATAIAGSGAAGADDRRSGGDEILEFDVMVGNDEPFLGSAHPIRGVNAGGAPWKLDSAEGELQTNGRLDIKVEGLVVAPTGVNPVDFFRGVVNCLTPASPDLGENLITHRVPATDDGDARIRAQLDLPKTCIAPIVFVTGAVGNDPTGPWFATTGAGPAAENDDHDDADDRDEGDRDDDD
jgi:hypothetical protein